jgi:hypothetical protein
MHQVLRNRGRCPLHLKSLAKAETRGNVSDSIWIPYGMILIPGSGAKYTLGHDGNLGSRLLLRS